MLLLGVASATTGQSTKTRDVSLPVSPFPAQPRWTLTLDEPELALMPAYDGAAAYLLIASDTLASYDLTDGTPRWVAAVHALSAPTVGEGLLFVEQPDALTALRSSDGSRAWQSPLEGRLLGSPSWNAGRVVAATESAVFLWRADDGSLAWRRDVPSRVHAAPTVAGELVLVPIEDGRILALRSSDGEMVWERRLGGAPHGIVVAHERVFVGSVDNFFYCLDGQDGRIAWRWRTGADIASLPIVDGSRVYFVSLDNVVRALNVRNGVQQWKRGLQFRPAFGPVRAGDTLLLTGLDGPPRAYRLKDGTPAGELPLEGGGEVIAPLHAFESAGASGPMVVAITRRLVAGAVVTTVTAASRSTEPPVLPLAPLPGLVLVTVPLPR